MFELKIICVSINSSYKNIARGISLLDKMVIFVCAGKYCKQSHVYAEHTV